MTTVKLNSGYNCPILGLGTWQSRDHEKLKTAVKKAIEVGYRHIDTAFAYGNEQIIGEALQELYDSKIVKREDLFLTTKIFPSHFRPELVMPTLKSQLEKLRTTYVDLYLLHFPIPFKRSSEEGKLFQMDASGNVDLDRETTMEDTWAAMEKCVDSGLTRSIGISNFNIKQTEKLVKTARIKPATNQVELHPFFQNTKLAEACKKLGVVITGYSPFGSPGTINPATGKTLCEFNVLEEPRLMAIAKKYNKTVAQVVLRWQIQLGYIVLPKSVTPSRVVENFQVWDFKLNDDDMKAIGAMDANKRGAWLGFPGLPNHPEYPFEADGGSC